MWKAKKRKIPNGRQRERESKSDPDMHQKTKNSTNISTLSRELTQKQSPPSFSPRRQHKKKNQTLRFQRRLGATEKILPKRAASKEDLLYNNRFQNSTESTTQSFSRSCHQRYHEESRFSTSKAVLVREWMQRMTYTHTPKENLHMTRYALTAISN